MRIEKYFSTFILFVWFTSNLIAQDGYEKTNQKLNKNSVSFEILGTGVIYSLNYERIFSEKGNLKYLYRIGFEFNPILIDGLYDDVSLGLLFEMDALYGQKRNKLEYGLGCSYTFLFESVSQIPDAHHRLFLIVPRIGYRFYTKSEKIYFKCAFTPFLHVDINNYWDSNFFTPFIGLGIGYNF